MVCTGVSEKSEGIHDRHEKLVRIGLHFCRRYKNLVRFDSEFCARCPFNGLGDVSAVAIRS